MVNKKIKLIDIFRLCMAVLLALHAIILVIMSFVGSDLYFYDLILLCFLPYSLIIAFYLLLFFWKKIPIALSKLLIFIKLLLFLPVFLLFFLFVIYYFSNSCISYGPGYYVIPITVIALFNTIVSIYEVILIKKGETYHYDD